MSEYQFLAFRAIDRPLTDREMVYARKQSTRAEITRWRFENEYHFGEFRGDAEGLLRHGYDVHLHYANFGIRKVALRLPSGLPFPKSLCDNYNRLGGLTWKKDPRGKGGILTLNPYYDAGELEEVWAPGDYLDAIVEIRNHLQGGDARVLYALWLCAAMDSYGSSDIPEPPVPGGLSDCLKLCRPLMEFFGLDPMLLVAASEGAPKLSGHEEYQHCCEAWLDGLSQQQARSLLREFLTKDAAIVKAETQAAIREFTPPKQWPYATLERTIGELWKRAEILRAEQEAKEQKKHEAAVRRQAQKQARERQERMKQMADSPQQWLRKTDQLVAARGTQNYNAAAEILADLREAVGGDEGMQITRQHAAHLAKKYPTLNHLKSSLRKRGLLE